jgi:hypothetical protein
MFRIVSLLTMDKKTRPCLNRFFWRMKGSQIANVARVRRENFAKEFELPEAFIGMKELY